MSEFEGLRERLSRSLKEAREAFIDLLWGYTRPRGHPAPRAFLFTINGLTYPIHRDCCVAGVPYPSEISRRKNREKGGQLTFNQQRSKRCYSMLAYLLSVRRGDLVFFFQADPQYPMNLDNRRGFRGIWLVASEPFMDTTILKSPSTRYEVLGACPNCGAPFDFGAGEEAFTKGGERKCLWCGKPLGTISLDGRTRYSRIIVSLRLGIAPLLVFRRTSGDNRVYSDMGTPPFIWVSRADNAMGPGKGSSIRILLPEEMAKIGYMLATEDAQSLEEVKCMGYQGRPGRIVDYNGQPIEHLRSNDGKTLQHELMLNLYFAVNIDKPNGPLSKLLGINVNEIEYWSSEFPWGYTGDTADFVLTLWDDNDGRRAIYLFEFKRDDVGVDALAEILLYVPWVSQVLLQYRAETKKTTVYPVLVGRKARLRKVPDKYAVSINTVTGKKVIEVERVHVLEYALRGVYEVCDKVTGKDIYYAKDIQLAPVDLASKPIKPIPPTYTTTEVERRHVIKSYLAQLKP